MLIRLNVAYRWHRPRDILDTEDPINELDAGTVNRLLRRRYATDVEDIITPLGGGMFEVYVSDGKGGRTERVRGRDRALKLLRKAAGQ